MRNALLNICTIFLEIDLDFVKSIIIFGIQKLWTWLSELCRLTTMGQQALKDSTLNIVGAVMAWPHGPSGHEIPLRYVGCNAPHFFFFELTPHVPLCFPRGSKQLSRGWCIDPVQGGNIPSGTNPSEILPQVKIAPKRYLRWISFEEFYFLVRIPSCPPLLLVIPAYLHPDSVVVHQQSFQIYMASLQSK